MNYDVVVGRFSASAVGDRKRIVINGPDNFGLGIRIDSDDVNPEEVSEHTTRLLEILNIYWPLS
jgi:hypothetical protein